MSTSDERRQSVAVPDSRTGKANTWRILRAADMFTFWFLASPQGRTEKRAFEKAEILL